MPGKKEMPRREAVKLAAAFGSALGFGAAVEAASATGRAAIRIERMHFKVSGEDGLISSIPLASSVAEKVMNENKLNIKLYRNAKRVNGGQCFAWEE